MLDKIKLALRRTHSTLDTDIQANIEACMHDLQRVGISQEKANEASVDPLINKAAEVYCKWQYDFNGKGELYRTAYESLRDALSLSRDYAGASEADV